jgi:hypothetical protein
MSEKSGPATPGRVLMPRPPSTPSALKRLNRLAANLPRAADLILVGDSLAAGWPTDLIAQPWQHVFNFGLPGDRIQHTLWRLDVLPLAHLRPERVVILLGTNNLGDGDEPDTIAAGCKPSLFEPGIFGGSQSAFSLPFRGAARGKGFARRTGCARMRN